MKTIQRTILAMSIGLCASAFVSAQVSGWGINDKGQLGNRVWTFTPTFPTDLSQNNVTGMSGGVNHSIFLKADGTVFTTGGNDNG